ncbi:putative 3-(3-hydroxyphenyl)propionate hydroxylase protein [Neofusicoccum parvum UCRNP2]|uniref:Putative 3-(3-hydroxyphenyl)propionate hydroxylase protein n=1 Tax=Botryosphaeria parva (strain UCR-NP2) TaxID=1287680 RepID=R1ESI8_BOTPV|nr:putative 3-(3-hydroxyphenyl)propionate hydroxylase protein [Neofusicoccum parvum UCRNP2]
MGGALYDCDVAVVGAGPVGMLTALLLHQLGNSVQILERRPERWNLPRAVTCYSQVNRILQALGVLEEVLEAKAIYPFRPHLADHCEWVGADGTVVAKIPFNGTLSRSGLDVVYGMNQMLFDQSKGQYRWLVLDVVPDPDTGSYDWKDTGFFRQYNLPERPCTSAPSLGFRRRIEFMLLPHEPSEIVASDEFVWSLIEPWGCTPTNAKLLRRTVFSPKGGWVDHFSRGRVVLAGDSAHNTPQFLGAGANTGLRDAKSLAWRLDLAVKHPTLNFARLFDDYSVEQHGIAEKLVTMALDVERMIAVTDPEEARLRDVRLSQAPIADGYPDVEALGPPGMYLRDEESVRAGLDSGGNLFIHDDVVYQGRRGPFDTVLGQGWILLGAGPEDPAAALGEQTRLRYKDEFEGSAFRLSGDDGFEDVSGRYTEWFRRNEAFAVLLRPDFYIYAIAKRKEEVDFVVRSALDHVFTK